MKDCSNIKVLNCPICNTYADIDIVGIRKGEYIIDCNNPNCLLSKFGRESKSTPYKAVCDWNIKIKKGGKMK